MCSLRADGADLGHACFSAEINGPVGIPGLSYCFCYALGRLGLQLWEVAGVGVSGVHGELKVPTGL